MGNLVQTMAIASTQRNWVSMQCCDLQDAAAKVAGTLYRSWGLMAVQGQARLKLVGLSHVGAGATAAHCRRVGSEVVHSHQREAYQLHHAGQRLWQRWL